MDKDLKKIASDINGIDDKSVVKVAGAIQRLQSWYKSLANPEYRESVRKMRDDSASIKIYLKELARNIDKFDSAVSNGNIDSYNYAVDRIKSISSELAKVMGEYNQTVQNAEASPEAQSDEPSGFKEPSLSGIQRVYFTDKMKSAEWIHSKIAAALRRAGVSDEDAKKAAADPNLFSIIEREVVKGEVIGSEPILSEGERTRLGEFNVYVQTKPFEVPGVNASLQLAVEVVDLSQRIGNPRPIMAIRRINDITARRKSASNKSAIVKSAATIGAIEGLEEKSGRFIERLIEVANNVGTKPEYLAAVMSAESGIKADAVNKMGGATGLIQFMPSSAKAYGTTTEELARMSDIEQLDYVEKFYMPYKGKLNTPGDVYMATFLPIFVGKPEDTIIGQLGNEKVIAGDLTYDKVYRYNKGFDKDDDGIIRVSDVAGKARAIYNRALKKEPITVNTAEGSFEDSFDIDREVNDLANYLGVKLATPLTDLVNEAIMKNELPSSKVTFKLSSDGDRSGLFTYAYTLSNALGVALNTDASVHSDGDRVEVCFETPGTLLNVAGAADGVKNVVDVAFASKFSGFKVDSNISLNKISSLGVVDDLKLIREKRKFTIRRLK
jgi:hypothetical protein